MAFDFEALVGHLYMVGGRAISSQPPGMLVEVAPKKAARGRELDTIFIQVLPSGDATAPPAFYDQMATLAAERYFNSSGSVTAGLRTVFNSLNQDLVDHNNSGKRAYEANLFCAVLREQELFLARAGAGVALLRHKGETVPFPTDFSNEDALFGPPLGVQPVPDIKMTRATVAEGTRLVICDSRLADIAMDRLTMALCTAEISDVLAAFKDMAPAHLTLLAVEFVPPDAPSPASVQDARTSSRPPSPAVDAEVKTKTAEVEAAKPVAVERKRLPNPITARLKGLAGGILMLFGRMLGGANHLLDRIIPPPPEGGRSWLRTSTATAIVLLIPVGIVGLVFLMGIGGVGESQFELCLRGANEAAQVARSINSSDRNGVLAAWNAVIGKVDECNAIRAGDPALQALTREAQTVIDMLFQVERRPTNLLESFPNATLTRIVLQGLDVYVLDSANQLVYRVSLASDGRGVVPDTTAPISVMRRGASIGEFRVGDLVDIAWSEENTQIMALDRSGLLIECSPRFLQSCQAQRLLAAERWVNPTRMTLWQGRLYLLDPGANQVWRYESSGGTYNSSPVEYFSGANRPDIQTAVGFGIDDQGSLYLLLANGQLNKWFGGEQTRFAYSGFPQGQELVSADALFLNRDPIGQALYMVSRSSRTVYETSLAGTFFNSYRAENESDFAGLSGVVADANQQVIYVLSGNSVFVFEKARSQTSP